MMKAYRILHRSGFSVVEVFLSIVLLGSVIAVYSQVLQNNLIAYHKLDLNSSTVEIQEKTRQHILGLDSIPSVEEGGELAINDLTVRWICEVTKAEILDTYYLEVEIDIPDSVLAEKMTLEFYTWRPSWRDSSEWIEWIDLRSEELEIDE